jgi:hypothetical protein
MPAAELHVPPSGSLKLDYVSYQVGLFCSIQFHLGGGVAHRLFAILEVMHLTTSMLICAKEDYCTDVAVIICQNSHT